MTAGNAFEELVATIERLRSPEGCPWDREQTLESLKACLIEEAYEVVQAIDRNDPEELREELGDVLMQVVFQAQIAKEEGWFDITDLIDRHVTKLQSRHPHVFSNAQVTLRDSQDVLKRWEALKIKEGRTLLAGLPLALPALMMANRMSEKVAHVGFDWPDMKAIMAKLDEEVAELHLAIETNNHKNIESELGDCFFTLVNIARKANINPEEALRKMMLRFKKRFEHIESRLAQQGKSLTETQLPSLDALWNEAKQREAEKTNN